MTIRIAKPFQGPRHDRLYAIWEAIAEYWQDFLRVGFSLNPDARWSHAQMYNKMWAEEIQQPEEYVILTEHDFLPNLRSPEWYEFPEDVFEQLDDCHDQLFAALACEYATRNPATARLKFRDMAAGWWILLCKERFNDLIDFTGCPDPANQLEESVGGVYTCQGEDAYPEHYGIEYPYGEHLFWSRHLHDDPRRVVSGFSLGDIQLKHDAAVRRYVEEAPEEFQEILKRNHAPLF